ncbi:MAG: TlpA family protein disulfide reductase [Myxococcales bacterium]|nr:TlpA family protein disulfide reductase [Myxococcales bacterium]
MWTGLIALLACTGPAEVPDVPLPTDGTVPDPTDTQTTPDETGTPSTTDVPCGPDAPVGLDEFFCAPDFTLPDHNGELHTLYDHRGDVLLVDMVGMWCHSCVELAPSLERMFQAYGDDGFEVFTFLAQDLFAGPATLQDAGDWVDATKATHPVVADTTGKVQWEWSRDPNNVVIPMTYIIDQDGVIIWFGAGDHHAPRMEEVVAELLGVPNQKVVDHEHE